VDTEDVNKKLQEALGNTTNFLQVRTPGCCLAPTVYVHIYMYICIHIYSVVGRTPAVHDPAASYTSGFARWDVY